MRFMLGKVPNPLRGLEHAFESAGRKTDLVGYAPQERVLSRFACMLASSSNGRAWVDFQLASYCDSCADKVIFRHLLLLIEGALWRLDLSMSAQIRRSRYHCSNTRWHEVHPSLSANSEIQRRTDSVRNYTRANSNLGDDWRWASESIAERFSTLKELCISSLRNVLIENQTLFDQLLPPIYQQNSASIMRTNYPGYFTGDEPARKQTAKSDTQSDMGALVGVSRRWLFVRLFSTISRSDSYLQSSVDGLPETYYDRTCCPSTLLAGESCRNY